MRLGTARSASTPPPGPAGYPLAGVFPMARRNPPRFFLECARQYGDVVSMRLGLGRFYLLSHPDHIKRVLHDNHAAYAKNPPAARVRPLFGESLTTVDGERWRRQRRLVRPGFQPRRFARFASVITEATADMLDRWERVAERGRVIDLSSEMRALTRLIILRVLFGDVAAVEARAVGHALEVALEHADRRLWSPLGWLDLPTPGGARFRRALRIIDLFVARMVDQARREACPPGTLLSMLVEADDAGGRMSDAQLRDEVKAVLVAGHTTTGSALAWVWYALSEHPEARRRLERELRAVLDGRPPGASDVPALPYTGMVIDEVLRLYPPTWVTARTLLHDDEIGGYRMAAGATVLLSPFVTHRHPGFWEDPERFEPDRFTPERSAGRPHFAFFPFGGGPRGCIGHGLASLEMRLVVAMVAQRCQLTLAPGARVDVEPGLTLRPRRLPMVLQPEAPGQGSGG